jgi:hypothetical protein
MNSTPDEINLNALLFTLAKQRKPLPMEFKRSLITIARSMQIDPTKENKIQLLKLVKDNQSIEAEYQKTLRNVLKTHNSQERMKGVDVISLTSINFNALDLLSSDDPVKSSKRAVFKLTQSRFFDRGDRLVTLVCGGAFLGVLFFQIPGAIVGALSAGIYAWLSFKAVEENI